MAILFLLCFVVTEAKSFSEYMHNTVTPTAMSYTAPADQCLNAPTLTGLSGGNPAGGIYSGPGVSDDGNGSTYSFDPASAGIGTHTLMYTVGGDVFSDDVIVYELPLVSIIGDDQLCPSETTQLAPSSGGSWMSSDGTVASANLSGFVTTSQPGTATFIFTSSATGCSSEPTDPIIVSEIPVTSIIGDDEICIGETSQLAPSFGGTWTSSNEAIATITNSGIVTGVDSGLASFIFTDNATGCSSEFSADILVNNKPVVTLNGADQICAGATTQMFPSSGGNWASNDINIATIDNNGLVTAVSSGIVTFVFTLAETGCDSDPSDPVTVLEGTVISIIGDDEICIGETTQMSPSEGGSWESSNNAVAMITSMGLITAMDVGIATFTFTDFNTGCSSETSDPVTVNEPTSVAIIGNNQICIGENSQLSPSTGGTWASSNEVVATVTNTGIVTGIDPGSATFIFTNTTTGCNSEPTSPIMVNAAPSITIVGDDELCIGDATELSPTGGSWTSSNNAIATIDNDGIVTTVGPGIVAFIFTDPATGCDSEPSDQVTVFQSPSVSITGNDEICIGETTQMSPSSGGTWISSDDDVATITNNGMVTGITSGTVSFTFTDIVTGCSSEMSDPVLIKIKPTAFISGSDEICIGETTEMYPSTGGTWISFDPQIASIDNMGIVTGLSAGATMFVFTDSSTGCSSDVSSSLIVNPNPIISISGADEISIGETTTLTPSTGGIWVSLDESIATIDNSGLVTGISVGSTNFIFTSNDTDCPSDISDPILVNPFPFIFIGVDGNWDIPGNWMDGVVPQIPIDVEVILMEDVTYSGSMMMTVAANGSISINNGIVFTINNDLKIENGGLIENNGGTIQIND